MYKVIKRDGSTVRFDISKISNAIKKAFIGCNKNYTDDVVDLISIRVTSDFQNKIKDGKIDVEDIQDSVEKVLSEAGYADVSKAYILYRKQRENIRNISVTTLDYKSLVNRYLNALDWTMKENSTITYSIGGLILSNSGAITTNYWLSEAYDEEVAQAHRSGDIHIHDLSMLSGYSAGWSIKQLLLEGLGGVDGKISRGPAKHLDTLCDQLVNFLGIMQNEWAGAQSFSSFDTYLAPFVKVDQLSYKEVKQSIQNFIYGVNTSSRWGSQAPFTTITLDWNVPNDLKDVHAIVGGKEQDFTYDECKEEMDIINQAFMEVMMEGDYEGKIFQYPIPTYSITKDFDWSESENNKLLFEMSAKYGIPYFSNDRKKNTIIQNSERNLNQLYYKGGGYFGSGELTGSIGAVTINLVRIAYESNDEQDFYRILDHRMDISARCLKTKRTVITKLLENGLYPYTKRYLKNYEHHFSTIGLVGMNEACLNAKWIQNNLTNTNAQMFAKEVLEHMQERLLEYQKQYGDLYNLEATPAESTAYRLAKVDREKYPDIITANQTGTPYYTNSSQLSPHASIDIFTALDIQDSLQKFYTSGTVFHVFVGEKLSDWKSAEMLVKKIIDNYTLPYFTLSPIYSVCKNDGYLLGEVWKCPKCSQKTEVFSRITGYYRSVKNWNPGKLQEFRERIFYDVEGKISKKKKHPKKSISWMSLGNTNNLLFISKTDASCKTIQNELNTSKIPYLLVDVDNNPNLVKEFGITQVPTLAAVSDVNTKIYVSTDQIMKYLDKR